jgi:3-deoxy-D-manno-octulosonic-acid transferase
VNRIILSSLCFIENFFFYIVMPWIPFFALFFPGIKRQFSTSRRFRRPKHIFAKKTVLFFCSSSGELEQAFPLINRFKTLEIHSVVFMQSVSGLYYAKAINSEIEIHLCPIDTIFAWQKIFAFYKPIAAIIIRHELWPSFIEVASRKSKLYLVNYSEVSYQIGSRLSRKFLLSFCHEIFSAMPAQEMERVHVIGDTKYDRVLERAALRKNAAESHKLFFESKVGKKKFMIIGSAWEWDLMHCMNAFLSLEQREKWVVIVVPHEIENTAAFGSILDQLEIEYRRYSRIEHALHCNCIIVDRLGLLAELYGIASACLIGGAFHAKIHNILEPAAWNLPIVHGPYYRAQQEAIEMVEKGVSTPVQNAMELARWWTRLDKVERKSSKSFVESKAGASDRFLSHIRLE